MKKITKLKELESLSKELGIELPEVAKAPSGNARAQVGRLLQFAIEHNFVITPAGVWYFVDSYNMFGCCPCDQERKSCPCQEAEEEVRIKGKCLCHLFWRDYKTYLEEKYKS